MALASAAPSGVIAPLAVVPAGTIDAGDIEAAAINAKVFAEDQAIAAIDKAREQKDLAIEEHNEKVEEVNDLVKEKNEELFWSVEEKKWQALDAVKTAEAQIDGSIANNADAIARSAYGGIIVPTYLASAPQVISPFVYAAPGFVAPANLDAKPQLKDETLVKTAEPEKEEVKAENVEEVKAEKVEEVKTEKLEQPKPEGEKKAEFPVFTPLALAPAPVYPAIKLAEPWAAPAQIAYLPQPYAVHTPLLAPALVKQW